MEIITLYRPVGQKELDLIIASGYTQFPPRLEWQPIFYPVMNQAYAEQIAEKWNTEDEANGFVGHVLAFDMPVDYIKQFPIHNVGGALHNELWIPADALDTFNKQIIEKIRLVRSFYGANYKATE